jgi:hypothetical protein
MTYTCPMHPQIKQEQPGDCPICHMDLVPEDQLSKQSQNKSWLATYQPLLIIIGLILLVTLAVSVRDWVNEMWVWQNTMRYFMAGFMLVFAGFKLIGLKGFKDGYRTYDLLAHRWPAYGYIYPFLELGLGLLYLLDIFVFEAHVATLILMSFSGLGVVQSLRQKRQIQCVCLGTIIDVPLTNVTLVEDFGMAAMALIMLLA